MIAPPVSYRIAAMGRSYGIPLLIAFVLLAPARTAIAQSELPTADEVTADIAELEATADPAAPNAVPAATERLKQLKLAATAHERIARFRSELIAAQAAIEQAPSELESLRLELAAPTVPPATPNAATTLEALEQRNATAKAALASARSRAEQLRAEVAALRQRPETALTERAETTVFVDRLRTALATELPADTPADLQSDVRAAQSPATVIRRPARPAAGPRARRA